MNQNHENKPGTAKQNRINTRTTQQDKNPETVRNLTQNSNDKILIIFVPNYSTLKNCHDMEKLNHQELAAICYHVLGGCNDKKILFQIAAGEIRYNKLKESSLQVTVSNWYKSHKIQEGIKQYKTIQEQKERERIDKIKSELSGVETESANGANVPGFKEDVNFLDLENFLTEANKQANKIKDDKERRAWLELIGKYMSFKDRNESETTEIKRFYTPIECQKCEIYNKCKGCTLSECPQLL